MKIAPSLFLDFENQYGIGQGVVNKMLDELKGKGTEHAEGAYATEPHGDQKSEPELYVALHSTPSCVFFLPNSVFVFDLLFFNFTQQSPSGYTSK